MSAKDAKKYGFGRPIDLALLTGAYSRPMVMVMAIAVEECERLKVYRPVR